MTVLVIDEVSMIDDVAAPTTAGVGLAGRSGDTIRSAGATRTTATEPL